MCNAIVLLDILFQDSQVWHSSGDDFISPHLKHSKRLKKKGPILRSLVTQQSNSGLVEVSSQEQPFIDERVIYYIHPSKLAGQDQDTILEFVSNNGAGSALPGVTRAEVNQVVQKTQIHLNVSTPLPFLVPSLACATCFCCITHLCQL